MGCAPRRFVILHHVGHDRPHWDFMLEEDESLATWRLYHDPLAVGKEGLELFRIGDHRKVYLDYEGPVSGDRGEVKRVCQGTYELLENNSQVWRIRLSSVELEGVFELRLSEKDRWVLTKIGEVKRAPLPGCR